MLSIIISTWNEENYLPKLLYCIKNQTHRDYEIIVVDGNSTDKTREIARGYGCKLILEPKNKEGHPGIGRNLGVKAAKGDILLFLNADVQFDNNFLKNALSEIKKRKLDVAGAYISPMTNKFIDKVFLGIFNFVVSITQFFYPNACGDCIFCKKWLHKKVNGFDETVILGEDLDYFQRCGKYGKFRIIKSGKTYFSMRRFDNEGRWKVAFRHCSSAIYRVVFGQIRSDIFHYSIRYKK